MQNAPVSNPNDLKVVSFHNNTDFGFTPEMGCMYDGRPINGTKGSPGIDAGETITLPYHVAHRLATNLAKVALLKTAPEVDQAGIPTGVPLWDITKLEALKSSYLTELYSEQKPLAMTETEALMAKVEELKKFVADNVPVREENVTSEPATGPKVYLDKQEVILELEKQGIAHDKRKNKEELEKLLA